MRFRHWAVLAVCVLAVVSMGMGPVRKVRKKAPQPKVKTYQEEMAQKYLLILGTSKNFLVLQEEAQRISRKMGILYSMEGNVYDKKRGLLATDCDRESADWVYYPRRYNDGGIWVRPFISIEKSDGYPGMKKGSYIIVGGVYNSAKEARQRLLTYKKNKLNGYIQPTKLYMGCMH